MKFLLSLIVLTPLLSWGQGSIAGLVRDVKSNDPVKYAQIYFIQNDSLVDSTITNTEGKYFVENLKSGEYEIATSKLNYHFKKIEGIIIQDKQLGHFNFYMQKGDSVITTQSLNAYGIFSSNGIGSNDHYLYLNHLGVRSSTSLACVSIVSYRTRLIDLDGGASKCTVTRKDLQSSIYPYRTRNIGQFSRQAAGVSVDPNGNITSIRGSRAEDVTYFVDGVKIRGSANVPISAINNYTVITGGLPANYGDATGGVVDIKTRSYFNSPNYYQPRVRPSSQITNEEPEEPPVFADQFSRESYEMFYENQFLNTGFEPYSTFSIDVDAASYTNVRRMLNYGNNIPPGAVRIEEFINYFKYNYETPQDINDPISIETELQDCPWNQNHHLLKIGMKGYEVPIDSHVNSNYVFLIDVSGSMSDPNKLPLLKRSMITMVNELSENDRVAIVVYASESGVKLSSTPGNQKDKIIQVIESLGAAGSTNGGAGIQTAYKIAQQNFIEDGNNRVILATDGDFNVGTTSNDQLVQLIEKKRKSNVFLTVLGFGAGNYQDDKMSEIAQHGNGNYFYIDTDKEGEKVLKYDLKGNMITIAKDVKIQVEFNPKKVKSYRLIGYENRLLAAQDFNDDTKDAGELGSGHTVTALYEIIPKNEPDTLPSDQIDPYRYQKTKNRIKAFSNEIGQVKLRFKYPDADSSHLKTFIVEKTESAPSQDFNFAAAVAGFGMYIRQSSYINGFTLEQIKGLIDESRRSGYYRDELVGLMGKLDN